MHGHTANEWLTREEKLSLQGWPVFSTPNISTRGSQPAQTQGPPACLAWPNPPGAPNPRQAHKKQGESGEGPQVPGRELGDTVKVRAPSSGASLPHIPWAAAFQPRGTKAGRRAGSRVLISHPDTSGTASCMANPVSSASSLSTNHRPAKPLEESHILATLQS